MPFQKQNGCVVYTPKSYDKTKAYPAIIFLHGLRERGDGTDAGLQNLENFLSNQWNGIAPALDALDKYILIAPQLLNNFGNWENQYVEKGMVLMQSYAVNYKRVYITGVSLGGGGVWKYLTTGTNSQKFAAAYSVCGVGGWTDLCAIKCPVWGIHAANDGVVGVGNTHGAIDGINACKPPVRAHKTILPTGDHYIWGPAYSHITPPVGETVTAWQWFDMNEQGSPVAVPVKGTPVPPPASTIQAIATIKNLTDKSATLDASGSTGDIKYFTWQIKNWPQKGTWNIFTSGNGGPIVNVSNLVAGNYEVELTAGGGGQMSKIVVPFTIGSGITVPVSPVFVESDIPQGKTHVVVREDKTVEFT